MAVTRAFVDRMPASELPASKVIGRDEVDVVTRPSSRAEPPIEKRTDTVATPCARVGRVGVPAARSVGRTIVGLPTAARGPTTVETRAASFA